MAHIVGVITSTRGDVADGVADDVQRLIEALRRPLHLSRNKSAAMYLPNGADKGAGLAAVLEYLGIGPNAVVGFGDAENDLAFLRLSGISVSQPTKADAAASLRSNELSGVHAAGAACTHSPLVARQQQRR